ncbi:Rz1-like lysis system protein LysC [Paenalcaligenes hominis]|uniref:Rz1-like lysis system protein LysC n=1 Tax=Paenalcaligenes hominis TaxID=643674 RepID=UPI003F9BE75F
MQSPKLLPSTKKWWCNPLCLIPVVLMMSGCVGYSQPSERPPLPASLVAPCPEVPIFDSDSWDDLAVAYIELVFMYGECRARHGSVAESPPT